GHHLHDVDPVQVGQDRRRQRGPPPHAHPVPHQSPPPPQPPQPPPPPPHDEPHEPAEPHEEPQEESDAPACAARGYSTGTNGKIAAGTTASPKPAASRASSLVPPPARRADARSRREPNSVRRSSSSATPRAVRVDCATLTATTMATTVRKNRKPTLVRPRASAIRIFSTATPTSTSTASSSRRRRACFMSSFGISFSSLSVRSYGAVTRPSLTSSKTALAPCLVRKCWSKAFSMGRLTSASASPLVLSAVTSLTLRSRRSISE